MNIGEAQNVSTLLDWLLGTAGEPPTSDQARDAAAALADRAYLALHAGLDAADVRELWPDLPDEPLGGALGGALSALHVALDLPDDEPSGPPITTPKEVP